MKSRVPLAYSDRNRQRSANGNIRDYSPTPTSAPRCSGDDSRIRIMSRVRARLALAALDFSIR